MVLRMYVYFHLKMAVFLYSLQKVGDTGSHCSFSRPNLVVWFLSHFEKIVGRMNRNNDGRKTKAAQGKDKSTRWEAQSLTCKSRWDIQILQSLAILARLPSPPLTDHWDQSGVSGSSLG